MNEKILKKHILNKYARFINIDNDYNMDDSSLITEAIETSDVDEGFCLDSTMETKAIENSDPDEFMLVDQSDATFTIETSDIDEFNFKN